MPAQKCVVDSCVHQMVAFLYHVRKLHTAYLLVHSESAESCPHVRLRTASWGPTCYASPWNSGRVMCVTFCFLCTSRGLHLIFYLFFFWFVSAFVCRGRGWTKQNKIHSQTITNHVSVIDFIISIYVNQFIHNAIRSIYANNPVIIIIIIIRAMEVAACYSPMSADFNPTTLSM